MNRPIPHLGTVAEAVAWLRAHGATDLGTDSRRLEPGMAWLAWPGARHDARTGIARALQAGVPAVLAEARGLPAIEAVPERLATFEGLHAASGDLASAFHGEPSRRLPVVAVTGTNGKTSVAWGVARALGAAGRSCGLVGTLGIGLPPHGLRSTGLTTPEAVELHGGLQALLDQGVQACALEASSIGIVEGRMQGVHLHTACFTQLTQDHLDYHGTMEAYWEAKQRLFDWPGLGHAVVHIGDAHGRGLVERLQARPSGPRLWTVGRERTPEAALRVEPRPVEGLDGSAQGRVALWWIEPEGRWPFSSPWLGAHGRENLAVVGGALRSLGLQGAEVAAALEAIDAVPGRLQPVRPDSAGGHPLPEVLVDYAHTPDALTQVLAAVRGRVQQRGGRLWCVVGCGGNRDRSKRPLMAAAAEAAADRLVLTSDNPRGESPASILDEMRAGLKQPADATVIEDRAAAIAAAIGQAGADDLILLAGKGHEKTQEIAGVLHPFDDAEVALRALESRLRAEFRGVDR